MADTVSLCCRIVALETELRLVREQLFQSQNGAAYLVSLLGGQSQLAARKPQDQKIEATQVQLDDALQCNERLGRLLDESRREKSILEIRENELSKDSGEYDEDLLAWSASEIGLRDGWATMESKNSESKNSESKNSESKNSDANVAEVQEPSAESAQIGRSEAKMEPTVAAKVETGTAKSVHVRTYSMDEVKQYDVQSADLRHVPWAPFRAPGGWPVPQMRPYARRPYVNPCASYEVTNLLHSTDQGLRRTVLVTRIPIGMSLADVLVALKSDRIVDAKFGGTAGMQTSPPIDSNAAIIEFLDHEDAEMFVSTYAKHQIFDLMIIPTATRPLRRSRVDSGYN